MAKVCKHLVKVNGLMLSGEIHYSASVKQFHFKFPQEIEEWGKVRHPDKRYLAISEAQKTLEGKILKVVEEYEKSAMKERKVIAFLVSGESTRMDLDKELHEAEDEYDKERSRNWAAERDESVSIELKMMVLLERTVGASKKLLKQVVDGHGHLGWEPCSDWDYDKWHFMDWSPKAEKFFNDFYGACEELVRRMDAFAGNPERVKKAITNSARLLEAPNKPTKEST